MGTAKQKPKKGAWHIARRVFRWLRISVWFAVLALLLLALWLNRVGFPDVLKERLVSALRHRGMDVQFTRMRLLFFRGIVADNIHFGMAKEPQGLRVSAEEADFHVRLRPLLRREFELEGVVFRTGHAAIPIWGTNDIPRKLRFERINGELHFLPNDCWELRGLAAEAFGVKLNLNGTITNASAVRDWKFGREKPKSKTPQEFWHDVVWNFEQTTFEAPSSIRATIFGDAREIQTFRANLKINSPAIDSPWGKGKAFTLSAQVTPQPRAMIHAEIRLQAKDADTRWGRAESVQLEAQLTPSLTQWTPTNAHLALQVKRAQTPWGSSSSFAIEADFQPNASDPASSLAEYSIRGQQIQTPWVRLARAEISAHGVVSSSNAWPRTATTKLNFAGGEIALGRAASGNVEATLALPPLDAMRFAETNLSWWTRLDQIAAEVTAQLNGVHSPRVDLQDVAVKSSWRAPHLSVASFDARLYDGAVRGSAKLDTATRLLSAEMKSDFDPRKATELLTTNALQWLTQFQWQGAPKLDAYATVTLPPWTNHVDWKEVKWRDEVLPTLLFGGNVQLDAVNFRGVDFSSAQSDFTYSNRIWRLPNVSLTRPEGKLHIAHVWREREREFEFIIDSTIDPRVLRPLFQPTLQRLMDDFTITSPPHLLADISGYADKLEEISFRAHLAATNFGFRLRPVLSCRTTITMTNRVVTCVEPDVIRTEGRGQADSVVIDIPASKIFINNARGMLQPADITHVIHPAVERVMEPYRFYEAPQAHVWGMVDLMDELGSDLHFELAGGPFEWRSFKFLQVTGLVHWGGPFLTISNALGFMHGGDVDCSLRLDFTRRQGVDFAFRVAPRDIDFHSLIADIYNPTNKVEGAISGVLVVTNANTENLQSWFGFGNVTLRDGLLWEVPVFGLFSPILNSISPGAGNQRAKEATATFIMTNSVIATSDLSIRASAMQLNYQGTVDFETRINGRMEAELFRNAPGLGPVVSKIFWPFTKLFEYKVTGTFTKPKAEPLYIPKIILMPLHPLRTMREFLEPDKDEPLPK